MIRRLEMWCGSIVLAAVVIAGVTAGIWYWRRRRALEAKLPQTVVERLTESSIVSGILADAKCGREVRWGELVITPKDRGPHQQTWRVEMPDLGVLPTRAVGIGELEAAVWRYVRAVRRPGVPLESPKSKQTTKEAPHA